MVWFAAGTLAPSGKKLNSSAAGAGLPLVRLPPPAVLPCRGFVRGGGYIKVHQRPAVRTAVPQGQAMEGKPACYTALHAGSSSRGLPAAV